MTCPSKSVRFFSLERRGQYQDELFVPGLPQKFNERARCRTWENRDGVILEMLNGNLIGGHEIEGISGRDMAVFQWT
jgi:hypothetical protein